MDIEKYMYICGLKDKTMDHIKDINVRIIEQNIHQDALYLKEDFAIFEVKETTCVKYPFKVQIYGFCLCQKGKVCGMIDLIPYEMKEGMVAVNIPGQLLTYDSISTDFKGIYVMMSPRFVNSLGLPYDFDLNNLAKEASVIDLSPEMFEALHTYCIMASRLLETERLFQAETLKYLTCAYFYGLSSYLYQQSENKEVSGNELLVKEFMKKMHEHYQKERKVSFYAKELCITPGYLSTIVANITGKTASEWIENFVSLEAKALLKSTNMTILQISDALNFPSQSFFGKFFKRIVGMSPKKYRETTL